MSKPITNGGRNPLSRKWNSFSGFSVFDRPFVYHSLNGSLDLEGSITPTSNVSMLTVISVIQLLSTKPWISISSVFPNISIERPLSAHSSDEFLPSNRQYSWSVLCMQRSLRSVPRWWFICRVNRKTKPLDSLTAKERERERSMQSECKALRECIWNSNGLEISKGKITYVDYHNSS